MACRYLELVGKAQDDGKPKDQKKPNGPNWFVQWYEATNIPKVSAQRMWDEFKTASVTLPDCPKFGTVTTPTRSPSPRWAFFMPVTPPRR